MTLLSQIQEIVVRVVPEIEKLVPASCPDGQMGCLVAHFKTTYRPITLADVLRAIEVAPGATGWTVSQGGEIVRYGDGGQERGGVWNLREDLDGQNELTLAFILKVLKGV